MPLDSIDPKVLDAFDKLNRALESKDYNKILSNLRRMGRPIKQAWFKSLPSNVSHEAKYKFTSNEKFKAFLAKKIYALNIPEEHIQSVPEPINYLKNQLTELAIFLMIWKEKPSEKIQSKTQENVSTANQAQHSKIPEIEQTALSAYEYQKNKFKGPVDKDDRHAINIALQAMAFILCRQANEFIQREEILNNYAKDFAWKNSTNAFIASESKEQLISFIFIHLYRMDKFKSYRYGKTIDPGFSLDNNENTQKQKIEKIGPAISSFLTPNKKKKFLKYAGILLAFIASLACGLSTGGAIFLLFPSLPILGIGLGALIAWFGFSANFGFFSQNFPNFILSFLKKGGISEYIDAEGKRRQLSMLKKYLFIPLATLASLTVGIGTVAITYTTVLALAVKLLPILAIIWPPLPLIIVGILAISVGIALTVAVLTATIEAIKNSQNLTWANIKEKLASLTKLQILGYALKAVLVLVGLFGLAYFRYTAGLDLSAFIGPIAAVVTGVIAYIPQAFFTVLSLQKLITLFTPSNTQEEGITQPISRFKRVKSVAGAIYRPICLIGNALGNAALVVVDSISALSISGAVGCFFNSWSGNIVEKDSNQRKRGLATAALAGKIAETFNTRTEGDASAVSVHSDSGQTLQPLTLKANSVFVPNEPMDDLPSPTHSEDGSMLVNNISRSAANYSNSYGSSSSHHFKSVLLTTPAEGAKAAELKTSARFK